MADDSVALGKRATTMRQRIEAQNWDDSGKVTLAKVCADPSALQALSKMDLSEKQLAKLTISMVQAADLAKAFPSIIARERAVSLATAELQKAIKGLRRVLVDASTQSNDRISSQIWISKDQYATAADGLTILEDLLRLRGEIARQTPVRLGTTRKHSGRAASENAGIRWLAQSIKRITGKAHYPAVVILAGVLFAKKAVTIDRVKGLLRHGDARDWRKV